MAIVDNFGSDEYIEYAVGKYSDMLLRLCFVYTKNTADAEDLVSEVFLSLIKRGDPFESEEHEKAWLLRLAVNRGKNFVRSGWFRFTAPIEENRTEAEDIPDTGNLDRIENPVLDAVLALPDKYKAPIHLFYWGGYSIAEIADILGKKQATVGTLLSRGRALLKDVLKEED
ncbi:MAG: sigma-70 family RNA polymerase sigma factor [Ruminococcus sp.]|jgi:RNA polymerase sigma-70 factor (ECF subfamily)|nr:sigma-70 family RNA polymerase sigma factor [Ruminococcus sp.]